ncbi:hypothetical protein [Paenibacillus xylanexedens]|uniref:hypothetical protein n=1 Tax=Paenibacillus xylanexedens TaxID=528191 RepID=UPI001643D4ED|nr:hypothetical protein [Paenibacillus xylanexedens]
MPRLRQRALARTAQAHHMWRKPVSESAARALGAKGTSSERGGRSRACEFAIRFPLPER